MKKYFFYVEASDYKYKHGASEIILDGEHVVMKKKNGRVAFSRSKGQLANDAIPDYIPQPGDMLVRGCFPISNYGIFRKGRHR